MRARTKVLIFAGLGLALNVGVAWGCALLVNVAGGAASAGLVVDAGSTWSIDVLSRPGAVRVHSQRFGTAGRASGDPGALLPAWTGFATETEPYATREVPFESRLADARGWPCLALWSEVDNPYGLEPDVRWGLELPPRDLPLPSAARRVLPLRPLPLGFAANWLLYAVVSFLPFLPFEIRRFVRRRRHQCVRCGYPIGRSATCSECGRPVPPPSDGEPHE